MQVLTLCKRTFLLVVGMMMAIIISGCSTGAEAPTNTQNVPNLAASPSSPSSTARTNMSSSSNTGNVLVKTTSATVDNKSETILTDTNGRTLYYFTQDALHNVACTTGCIDSWPPLLYNGTGTVSASTNLSGTLATEKTTNGNQVTYNGHYLYTYSGDSAPGDIKGQGIGGKWYVATADLKENQPVHTGGS
jgi:predicted lipoprotein with Yx(FWY)xxD motif